LENELAEIISLVIVGVAIIGVFSYFSQLGIVAPISNMPAVIEANEHLLSPGVYGFYSSNSKELLVINKGNQPIVIDKVVVKSPISNALLVQSTVPSSWPCLFNNTVVPPGSSVSADCGDYVPLVIIGGRGEHISVTYMVGSEVITRSLNETNLLENRISYYENQTGLYIDQSLRYPTKEVLQTVKEGSTVFRVLQCRLNTTFVAKLKGNNIILTKDPSSPGLWNILIAGGDSQNTDSYVTIGGNTIYLKDNDFYKRYRVVLWSFSGAIYNITQPSSINAITSPGIYTNLTLLLNGTADYAALYTTQSGNPSVNCPLYGNTNYLGYDPYFIVGDLFDRGYQSFILTTIDYSTQGDGNSYNDYLNSVKALDYSQYPLRVIINGYPINSTQADYVRVTVKLWFWDNSLVNIGETTKNGEVFWVGLYDPTINDYVYKYPTTYYEIQRYEGYGYVKEYLIPTPKIPDKAYYVAFDIVDPYDPGLGNKWDDVDFTLVVDYIGIVLGAS